MFIVATAESHIISCADGNTPSFYLGDYYSLERGMEVYTYIGKNFISSFIPATGTDYVANCVEYLPEKDSVDNQGKFHSNILFYDR